MHLQTERSHRSSTDSIKCCIFNRSNRNSNHGFKRLENYFYLQRNLNYTVTVCLPYCNFHSTSNKFEVKIMRPENALAASMFYDDREARKYTSNSHMIQIQSEMAERALELLALPEDESSFLLDIGCGSGLAGEILTERDHIWVGLDISQPMLNIAKEREVEGTLILGDMGNGLPFRPGSFDGAISVSALQWLCYAEEKRQNPVKRLHRFFLSLYACLSRGSRAALQFYPDQPSQVELIMQQAMIAGFTGGVVVDYPESTRAKKIYLVLFTGGNSRLPAALTNECPQQNHVHYAKRSEIAQRNQSKKPLKKSKEWIMKKKVHARTLGKQVTRDSKYTGRKRKGHF